MVEKIVEKFASGSNRKVQSGDFVRVRPHHLLTHDNTAAVLKKFRSMGVKRIRNPHQAVFALDHDIQNMSVTNLEKYSNIEKFAQQQNVDFYPAGRGIGHQVMIEEGYAFPGTLVVASDSHANIYGGIACLGTPVVRTDAAAIWATGETWWQVPPVVKVELKGKMLPAGVSGKDIIIALCGIFNKDEVLNHVIEFSGEAIECLTIEDRLTISNMTTEWGALAGIFPCDAKLIDWLRDRAAFLKERGPSGVPSDNFKSASSNYANPRINEEEVDKLISNPINADEGAEYTKHLVLDIETLSPYVCGPNSVKNLSPVYDLHNKDVKIHKAYIVSCVNSRVQDLKDAAAVLKDKKIDKNVELYVAAASDEVQRKCESDGTWKILLESGARPLPPGCGPCIGMGAGLLKDGEVGISATNRNFKGRMGSRSSFAYLASPAVVAASAIAGKITSPALLFDPKTLDHGKSMKFEVVKSHSKPKYFKEPLIEGFPKSVQGRVLFLNSDNINTDGIYAGKYTYREDLSAAEMASASMENYDPNFVKLAGKGDILLCGYNFGTGSSREQAVTCLQHLGISMVIAGSFSATYQRNALNNGFLVLESPGFLEHVRSLGLGSCEASELLIGDELCVDFVSWELLYCGLSYSLVPLGSVAQELIVSGGINR
jgi:homoaconitate hydratase